MRCFRQGKKGCRVLGIAESFKEVVGSKAVLAGVVMRIDGPIDGAVFGSCTVGGMDSTDAILSMFRQLGRDDVNLIMLNGCIISLFNVIDINRLAKETGTPLLCVTYNPSEGLTEHFKNRFPLDWEYRLKVYESNGPREEVTLRSGYKLYIRRVGIGRNATKVVLNATTHEGKVPEPLRIARILARAELRYLSGIR